MAARMLGFFREPFTCLRIEGVIYCSKSPQRQISDFGRDIYLYKTDMTR